MCCDACWASAAVSVRQIAIYPQHEASSPLAISFSHRAKVTWLTTVSHLTMQKDCWATLRLGSFLTIALLQQTMKGHLLRACVPFAIQCVKYCSHSHCFSKCTTDYTCGKNGLGCFWALL